MILMNRDNKKNTHKNSGFTLLEVLIAMTILAIIVAPLLHGFVTAARTNQKARKIMRATTAAENIMEQIKATSVADIARNVNGQTLNEKGQPVPTNIVSGTAYEMSYDTSNGKYVQVPAANSCIEVVTELDGVTVKSTNFKPTADDSYAFLMSNANYDGQRYDAVMKFDVRKSADTANINSMNQSDCAYAVQPSSQAAINASIYAGANVNYLVTNTTAPAVSASEFMERMTKTVTLEILKSAATGATTVNLSYVYDCGAGVTAAEDRLLTEDYTIFENYGSDEDLKAIYFYYYPLYSNGLPRDKFIIKNMSGLDVSVYLISMQDLATYSAINEAQYKLDLNIQESPIPGQTATKTVVCSNVEESKFVKALPLGLSTTIGNLGHTTTTPVLYDVTVSLYTHNASNLSATGVFTPNDDDYILSFTGSLLDDSKLTGN